MLARSSSRGTHKVRVLAVHTTEGIMRAVDLRAWASWPGSSHASADETGVLLTPAQGFVPYERASWTLRSGNPWSENIELCGFAKWKRDDWLARPKLLDACARWLGERSKARGIPLVKLSPTEYRAGRSGVIGHHDHTVGYSDGTHWDPGPGFPWDVVLDKARGYAGGTGGDDMSAEDVKQINEWVNFRINQLAGFVQNTIRGEVVGRIAGLEEVVKQLAGKQGAAIDLAAVRDAAREGTAAAIESIDTTVRFDSDDAPPAA